MEQAGPARKKTKTFNDWDSELQHTSSAQEEEYVTYFRDPPTRGGDVLIFWRANAHTYPVLSAMAKDYLTIQASSVPSERAFSSGVDLVTPDRCSLAGSTIEMTQFLKFQLPRP